MKIVAKDNFDRDNVSEWLVASNIRSKEDAEIMCEALRTKVKDDDPWWFKVEEDDYELYKWEP